MTKANRLEVSREEAISFCESALRNIGSLHLCADDIDDIAGALTIFRKKAIETNTRTGDTGEGSGASASPTVATREPSPSGLGPSGECQLADCVAALNQIATLRPAGDCKNPLIIQMERIALTALDRISRHD